MTQAHLSNDPHHWHEVPHAPKVGTTLTTLAELPDGQATLCGEPFRVLLLRSGSVVKAYVNRCAHFGVPLATKQSQLLFQAHTSITCNVHYARYRWTDGYCEAGDCTGESLLSIPVLVDAQGQVCIAP